MIGFLPPIKTLQNWSWLHIFLWSFKARAIEPLYSPIPSKYIYFVERTRPWGIQETVEAIEASSGLSKKQNRNTAYLVAVDKILPFAFALICTPMKSFLLHLSSNELPQRLIPLCLTEILLQLCPYCNELLCLLVTPLRDTFLLLASPAQCHGTKVAPSYIRWGLHWQLPDSPPSAQPVCLYKPGWPSSLFLSHKTPKNQLLMALPSSRPPSFSAKDILKFQLFCIVGCKT